MKRVLSLALALVMLISCFGTITANASTPTKINNQVSKAAAYIVNNSNMSDISYGDYWLLLDAGYDMSAYKDDYLAKLKANLDTNEGKIVISGTNWYQDENEQWQSYSYSYEDIAVYGAVIATLNSMGLNPASFEGYDITAPFLNFDLSGITNPYSYRLAIFAASDVISNTDFAMTLANDMIARYYTKGSGMDYYGFSCDNTAHFIAALYPIASRSNYYEYIDDACGVLKSYTTEDGAYADSVYVTTVNADSTALAMYAFICASDIEAANWYYKKLIDGFYNSETGAFVVDNADNIYATKDALLGLTRLAKSANMMHCYGSSTIPMSPAGFNHNGTKASFCELCGDFALEPIYAIDSVTLSNTSYAYNGKAKTPAVKVTDVKGTPVSSEYYKVEYASNKNAGTGKVTVTFSGLYYGTKTLTFKINKASQPLTAKAKAAKNVKFATVKNKNVTIAAKDAISVSKAQGTVTYAKKSGNKNITVNKKTGKITVKKGIKKGTYKVSVKVSAAGNNNYKGGSKTVTVTIKVK